ncbi:hypothetical protein K3152_00690 [Qipengyuania sp. 1NDH17]|uniref:TonB-dependent receptor n=1 Tax=Qipengyuania polymorpha TaxID=2867234 RepID=A0ABS7ITS2_9SPHN|nr:hypothetical protein [Qipengyuania polymorpha]MBX7456753.1 hypothetical protein [Qipengyuania polymorpha]
MAQDADAGEQEAGEVQATGDQPRVEDGDILVFGTRLKGQLNVDRPPLAEYDEADIAALGAGSIADIVAAIAPATNSGARGSRGGGRPVFLINGIRVSGWREFRSYPPESVAKVEVFSEEVAQRFGYSPDQRVVNIILKPNFQSLTGEVEYEQPEDGGFSRNEQELTWLKIGEKGRLNLNAQLEDRSLLTEAERGLVTVGSPEAAEFRSLVSDTMSAQLEANYARAVIETGTSFNINGTVARSESRSLSGLAVDGTTPLERRGDSDSYSAALSVNQPLGGWVATFTSDANITRSATEIDRNDASGFDTALSRTYTTVNKLTVNGFPLQLPAGELSTTLDLGFDWKHIESEDSRVEEDLGLTRRRFNAGLNVVAPIARRGEGLGAIGDISLTATGGVEDLSDFGTLANWTLGANWSPTEKLSLSATRIWREVAPSLTNLGSPRIDELNATVFDYRSGETVLATLVTGGNPDLLAETQADWKFGANWELPFWKDTRLSADYGINRSRDVTSTPAFSSAFEQAFPDRVERDVDGSLLAVDRRPLTLFETRSRILSFGLFSRGQIGKAPARSERSGRGGPPQGAASSGQGRPGGGGGFDPARMQAMREAFCNTPEGETPDLSQIPEMFRARLLDADGNPDPEKIAAARARFCGAEADERGERFAAMRTAVCADPPKLDDLPEEMLARLKNEDGEIDPEKLKALRERMCSADGAQPQGQPGGGRRRGGMSMFGGDPSDTRPRYFLSLNHNITLESEVLLAEGGPLFDQLDGFVLGGGAPARHSSRLEGGIFWQGYGMRLSGRYTGKAVVRGGNFPGASDLFFDDIATFDIRLFTNLGEVFDKEDGWMDGLTVSVLVDNVFDGQRRVTDENGVVPDAYDPRRINPTGRYYGIDIRKVF